MEIGSLYNIEIPLKEIFNSMKNNISDIFSTIKFTTIPKEYISKRSQIFTLIHKISNKMGFKSQTYFLSIYYLDIIFSNQPTKIDCNYNILALSCLLLSAKYSENDPVVPELKYFIRIYNSIVGSKNSISVSDLFYAEVMTIKMLNYKLNYYSIYDFNSFFFGHCILNIALISSITVKQENKKYLLTNNLDNKINVNYIKYRKIYEKIYKKSRYFLDKIINTELALKYNSLLLSIYIMKKSIELAVLNENKLDIIDYNSKEKLTKKSNKFFSDILINFYNFDIEKNIEYKKLIEDYEISKIFQKSPKKPEFSSSPPQNINKQQNSENNLQVSSLSPNKPEIQKTENNIKILHHRLNEINNSAINVMKLNKKSTNTSQNKNYLTKYNQRIISSNKNKDIKNDINKSNSIREEKKIKKFIEKYKENYNSDCESSISKNSNVNALKFLNRVNTHEYYKSNYNSIKSNETSLSPEHNEKFKNLYASNKNFNILKVNKIINESENNNYNSEKNYSNSKPYYRKVIQNCGNSLRKFNVLSNIKLSDDKLNSVNNSKLQTNKTKENSNFIGELRKKIAFNELSEEKNLKISNVIKLKGNISDNENEKMPRNTLHVTKKLNIKKNLKNNVKKIYSNNSNNKKVNQHKNTTEMKIINIKDSNDKPSYLLSNQQLSVNLKNNNIKKNENNNNKNYKFKKTNTMTNLNNKKISKYTNENNYISNTFASIHQKNGRDPLNMSTKTNNFGIKKNFSDYQCSTDEKITESDLYNSVNNDAKSIRSLVGSLFKNQLLNKTKNYKNEEERFSQGTYNSTRYSYNSTNKNNNYKDKEIFDNNKVNIFGSGMKINRHSTIGNNLLKRIQSTIVINNNININIGNKGNNYRKKYKNSKNYSIHVNTGSGTNSINSLLSKIPLVYKDSEKK